MVMVNSSGSSGSQRIDSRTEMWPAIFRLGRRLFGFFTEVEQLTFERLSS